MREGEAAIRRKILNFASNQQGMKLLIVAATEAEIAPFLKKISGNNAGIGVLVTGVGVPATVYQLTRALLQNRYDLVINAGIAGTFDTAVPVGTVVQVASDCFADLGAEDGDDFLDVFRLGLTESGSAPYTNGRLENGFRVSGLPAAEGITVNTVHGNQARIERTRALFPAMVESMEGAGFFYVCLNQGQRCLQVRAISNYVEKRNRENWNIPLAVKNLNTALAGIVEEYSREPHRSF